jgi:L-ascorbate metabolism protein UlaG (beta-lactamase superfamily)
MSRAVYLGHAAVLLTHGKHRLLIDPFLTGNPRAAARADEIAADYILVSHGHDDHLGDTIPIARRTGATVIAAYELAAYCAAEGVETHAMHIGGAHDFDFGRVKLTIAHHGGGAGADASRYTGPPVGFLITLGESTIYHPGDTGLFYDMKLIGETNRIELAFLPIGDNFTMGIDDAVRAVEFLHARRVVPIHYGTFPDVAADPHVFAARVTGAQVTVLEPGAWVEF